MTHPEVVTFIEGNQDPVLPLAMLSIGASTLPPSNFTSGGVPISMQDSCVTDHNMTATFFATSGLKSAHQATDGRMSFNRGN